jgi:glycosyltransferase involved in cell wall biosynthesis
MTESAAMQGQEDKIIEAGDIRPVLILDVQAARRNSVFLQHFFVALTAQSVRAAVVCSPDFDSSTILSPAIKVITHPACRIPLFWRQNRAKLMEQIEKFNPSVLHCIPRQRIGLTRAIAHQFDLPYILTARGMDKFHIADIADPLCASIVVPCASIRNHLAKTYPDFVSRIEQIETGAFVEDTCACFAKPQRLPGMIAVCPVDKAANFQPLLEAIRHLAIDTYQFVVVIIGTGKADSAVRRLIRAMGLSQIVNVVPSFDHFRAAFAEADICIRPKPVYAFSVPLLEAMSVGMVVAGCKGGVDDLLIEDQTAVLFNPDDHLSIYSKLRWLLDNKQEARRLAMNAQAYLRQHHTVSKMMSGLIGAYEHALTESKSVAR